MSEPTNSENFNRNLVVKHIAVTCKQYRGHRPQAEIATSTRQFSSRDNTVNLIMVLFDVPSLHPFVGERWRPPDRIAFFRPTLIQFHLHFVGVCVSVCTRVYSRLEIWIWHFHLNGWDFMNFVWNVCLNGNANASRTEPKHRAQTVSCRIVSLRCWCVWHNTKNHLRVRLLLLWKMMIKSFYGFAIRSHTHSGSGSGSDSGK